MTQVQMVDNAITLYLQSVTGSVPRSVHASTLAHIAGVPIEYMSQSLQLHRAAQGKGLTKYVLGCEGHGRYAEWVFLAKPNSDPQWIQQARKQHGKHVARDTVKRYFLDVLCEVKPGLKGAPDDQLIDSASNMVAQSLEAAVQFIESVL